MERILAKAKPSRHYKDPLSYPASKTKLQFNSVLYWTMRCRTGAYLLGCIESEVVPVFPTLRTVALGFTTMSALLLNACMDQYHPEPYWAQFSKERETAARPQPRLTESGELPTPGGEKVPIDQKYAQFCANCHGAQGNGDGPAGLAMNPKPRVLTDPEWQAKVDDARIANVLKNGGAAVGLSSMMAPWGSVLSDDEITEMVAFIRSLKK